MWLCKCECGNLIEVSTTDLRCSTVKSCGKCPERQSIGELQIKKLLLTGQIPFIQEYSFKDFIYETGHHPRFDFYIPSLNCVIEYDGKQHFEYSDKSNWNNEKNFELTKKNEIK